MFYLEWRHKRVRICLPQPVKKIVKKLFEPMSLDELNLGKLSKINSVFWEVAYVID